MRLLLAQEGTPCAVCQYTGFSYTASHITPLFCIAFTQTYVLAFVHSFDKLVQERSTEGLHSSGPFDHVPAAFPQTKFSTHKRVKTLVTSSFCSHWHVQSVHLQHRRPRRTSTESIASAFGSDVARMSQQRSCFRQPCARGAPISRSFAATRRNVLDEPLEPTKVLVYPLSFLLEIVKSCVQELQVRLDVLQALGG